MTIADSTTAETRLESHYKLHGVSKRYGKDKKQVVALDSINLEIPAGQFVAIQGPTGGGKSTLLQMLGALDRPTSGSVRLGHYDLSRLGDRALARVRATEVGFVFQAFNLIPTLTAAENVRTAFENQPSKPSPGEIEHRSAIALEAVGLADRSNHLPGELSGGQQQRVAIARALVKNPKVLLADEPTGALDETTRDEIMDLIESHWTSRGLTVVIVTHDSRVACRSQRRLHINRGVLTEA